MNRLLFGFVLLAVSGTVPAADVALYKVELIVFENLDPAALQAEEWPADPGTPSLEDAMELPAVTAMVSPAPGSVSAPKQAAPPVAPVAAPAAAPAPATQTWRRLRNSELSLSGLVQKLSASPRYRPIVHVGWIQPLDSSDEGSPVHIYDGMDLTQGSVAPQAQAVSAPQAPEDAAPPPAQPDTAQTSATQAAHLLDGTITLRRERFLHVEVDLGYRFTEPAAEPAAGGETVQAPPASQYVHIIQSRRIRDNELHYLDNPLFGVLFVVSPYLESPAAQASPATAPSGSSD